jgi:hypothetical protein
VYPLRLKLLVRGGTIEIVQHLLGSLNGVLLANQTKLVATVVDLDAEAPFDQPQVLIQLTADVGQSSVIGWLQGQIQGFRVFSQLRFP